MGLVCMSTCLPFLDKAFSKAFIKALKKHDDEVSCVTAILFNNYVPYRSLFLKDIIWILSNYWVFFPSLLPRPSGAALRAPLCSPVQRELYLDWLIFWAITSQVCSCNPLLSLFSLFFLSLPPPREVITTWENWVYETSITLRNKNNE